jgi:hypothetical protein
MSEEQLRKIEAGWTVRDVDGEPSVHGDIAALVAEVRRLREANKLLVETIAILFRAD